MLGYEILEQAIVHGAHVRDGYGFIFSLDDSVLTIKRNNEVIREVSCQHSVKEAILAIECLLLKQGARA